MAEVFHSTFDSDTDGFTGGTHDSSVGSAALGATAGALRVGAGVTAYRDFTPISSGDVRLDCWVYESNTTTASSTATVIYLLENGAAVNSANTAGCVFVDRASAFAGATTTAFKFGYRDSTGFVYSNTFNVPKGQWYKLSVITRISSKTFDIALDDVILIRGAAWANASATGVGRVAFAGNASAPDTWFDNVRVESSWTEGESVIVDHDFVGGSGEIEDSTPTTYRDTHAQKWLIPTDTTNYGGFTLGTNGATPDASKNCIALQRCSANGILELEFKTPSSGTAYAGIAFRFWDYFTATLGGGGLVRISGSGNTVALLLPDRTGTLQTVASASFTPAASTTYTLRIEMRGRVMRVSHKTAAIDSGSYTTAFTHTVSSSATGGRGMLAEELAGPFVASAVGTADIRRFRATGKAEPSEAVRTIGDYKLQVGHGSVKELYYLDSAAPTNNLFWSRGIQYGHRSSADMCGAQQQQVIYDETNLYAARQTGGNVTEYQHLGKADCYITLLMRGPWISDGILPTDVTENFAPDLDLRPGRWSTAFLTAINSGSATSRSDASFHDWTAHNSGATLPGGNQSLSAYGSGQEFHASQVVLADGTVPSSAWDITSKFEGNGDPISRAVSTPGSNLTAGTALRVARAFLFRPASALSATVLQEWRDDLASPGTLSFTTGSAKTDAAGDTGATGFNKRHGWYEITCSGGNAEWTLPVASGTRHWPVFRLHGWDSGSTVVTINGSPATSGTDYVLDDCGGGVAVLQLLADYAADVDIEVGSALPTLSALTTKPGTLTSTGFTPRVTAS